MAVPREAPMLLAGSHLDIFSQADAPACGKVVVQNS